MENIINNQYIVAVFLARVFLGFLFFFQGYETIVRVGIKTFAESYEIRLARKGIPKAFTLAGICVLSFVQFIGGIFLIIGLVKYYVLYLLGIILIIALIAYGFIKPRWNIQIAFPRLVILIFLLVIPYQWDVLSLDYFYSFINFLKTE